MQGCTKLFDTQWLKMYILSLYKNLLFIIFLPYVSDEDQLFRSDMINYAIIGLVLYTGQKIDHVIERPSS